MRLNFFVNYKYISIKIDEFSNSVFLKINFLMKKFILHIFFTYRIIKTINSFVSNQQIFNYTWKFFELVLKMYVLNFLKFLKVFKTILDFMVWKIINNIIKYHLFLFAYFLNVKTYIKISVMHQLLKFIDCNLKV